MKKSLIIGGFSALGKNLISSLSSNWQITRVEFKPLDNQQYKNIITIDKDNLDMNALKQNILELSPQFDSIFCLENHQDTSQFGNVNIFNQINQMLEANLFPGFIAMSLAQQFLKENGLLVFQGSAQTFQEPTPNMPAYALAMNSLHTNIYNFSKQIQFGSRVVTILPQIIDDDKLDKSDPKFLENNKEKIASPEAIAGLLKMWADGYNRPENGTFALLKVQNGMVIPEFM